MAKTFTATIDAKAWKQHTCVGCGDVYSYELSRKVTGQAPSAEQAELNAQANVARTLTTEVDSHPCPTCGLFQPDMIGQSRAARHKPILIVTAIVFLVLIILRAAYAVQSNTITLIAVVVGLLAVALHLLVELRNPNKDADANRRTAAERVTAGAIRNAGGRAGTPPAHHVSPSRSPVQIAALAALLIGAALLAVPEIMRSVKGWPVNDVSYPPVAGPGDVARVYMDSSISSIKGYWRGWPEVSIQGPQGEAIEATATTNEKSWGSSISAKSSEKSSSSTPWLEISLPDRPDRAGQSIEGRMKMKVLYPAMSGSSSFDEIEQTLQRTVQLKLAGSGAGRQYNAIWWQATVAGALLILVSGIMLVMSANALKKRANPTQVYP